MGKIIVKQTVTTIDGQSDERQAEFDSVLKAELMLNKLVTETIKVSGQLGVSFYSDTSDDWINHIYSFAVPNGKIIVQMYEN